MPQGRSFGRSSRRWCTGHGLGRFATRLSLASRDRRGLSDTSPQLGPLDLDLLGLVVHLDRVVLDITAESGPGNLLGNLLCAITGLLDPAGPLGPLVNLLNQLLDILGNL